MIHSYRCRDAAHSVLQEAEEVVRSRATLDEPVEIQTSVGASAQPMPEVPMKGIHRLKLLAGGSATRWVGAYPEGKWVATISRWIRPVLCVFRKRFQATLTA